MDESLFLPHELHMRRPSQDAERRNFHNFLTHADFSPLLPCFSFAQEWLQQAEESTKNLMRCAVHCEKVLGRLAAEGVNPSNLPNRKLNL